MSDVPQFVSLGFDDNAYSGLDGTNGTGGVTWAAAMAAARGVHVSFYLTTIYIDTWESESNGHRDHHPTVKSAEWDEMAQIREEASFAKGRVIVRGKLVTRGQPKGTDYILLL